MPAVAMTDTFGMVAPAQLFQSAVHRLELLAKIHQAVSHGQRERQARWPGAVQNHTVRAIPKAVSAAGVCRI